MPHTRLVDKMIPPSSLLCLISFTEQQFHTAVACDYDCMCCTAHVHACCSTLRAAYLPLMVVWFSAYTCRVVGPYDRASIKSTPWHIVSAALIVYLLLAEHAITAVFFLESPCLGSAAGCSIGMRMHSASLERTWLVVRCHCHLICGARGLFEQGMSSRAGVVYHMHRASTREGPSGVYVANSLCSQQSSGMIQPSSRADCTCLYSACKCFIASLARLHFVSCLLFVVCCPVMNCRSRAMQSE
jgi:hypothetical protein